MCWRRVWGGAGACGVEAASGVELDASGTLGAGPGASAVAAGAEGGAGEGGAWHDATPAVLWEGRGTVAEREGGAEGRPVAAAGLLSTRGPGGTQQAGAASSGPPASGGLTSSL